ncbi:hypothetical protein CEE45_04150 [Candidatus Heimdallarchaeota archaeon B3_Heim]|nr:MAG: hypothetical protein CEE45_04150 [Candidatus Heimdallarchaeota archaeon B3_Heim]
MSESTIQCPCGRTIHDYSDYSLLYLKKEFGEGGEIDILCKNDYCYLRELGYLKFSIDKAKKVILEKGKFYAPYVTWNATRMSEDRTVEILKQHLVDITEKLVQWQKVMKSTDEEKVQSISEEVIT